MSFLFKIVFITFSMFHVLLFAETGMALVITATSGGSIGVDFQGTIRRIDIKDNQVVHTTGTLGVGRFARFSPDGSKFAYLKEDKTLTVSDLEGKKIIEFPVAEFGQLSYTIT